MKTAEELRKDLDAALTTIGAMRVTQAQLIRVIADQRQRIDALEMQRDLSTRAMDRLRTALHAPLRDERSGAA